MALGANSWKVALVLICTAALANSRAARKKRQSDLINNPGASSTNLCQPLAAPAHGTIACGAGFPFYSCTASCDAGYEFPSGTVSDKRDCDQMFGEWFDPPGTVIPDCVPKCDTPCENGGACIAPNQCSCPAEFIGMNCEYPASNCKDPPSPANGRLDCNHDSAGAVCTATCNQGFKPTWAISPSYSCAPEGTWSPPLTEIPGCVSESTVINVTHTNVNQQPSTGSARCVAWGQDHYRTFDNKVYHYKGACQYVLVKDVSPASAFQIFVQNDKNCHPGHRCKRELRIAIGNDIIALQRQSSGAVALYNGAPVRLPSTHGGVIFEKVSHYTIVRSSLGFNIRWDGYEMVFVTVTDDMKGKVQGLCGTYDRDQSNDFTTSINTITSEPSSFASTWKRALAGEDCPEAAQDTCASAAAAVVSNAETNCNKLMGTEFQTCHHAVDPAPYIAACRQDCCASGADRDGCKCNSFEAYSRACLDTRIQLDWRSMHLCPIQCSSNLIYKDCGSMCQRTCESPAGACEDHSCIDGCFCEDGYVLMNETCIPQSQCPCISKGKPYKSGDVIPKECNKCTCQDGSWSCTNKKCEATCSAVGDPHYMTFDGKRYDFMGECSYYMISDPNFDIITDNVKCGHGLASCTKSVTLRLPGHTIKMDHNHQLTIDGTDITALPFETDFIKIYMVSSLFMKAELSNGINALWDGRTRVYITVPTTFINKTEGLCGTFDHNQKNDFKTKEGDIETNVNAFGNRWKTVPTCKDVPLNATKHPCEINPDRANQSHAYCNYIKSDIFKECHDLVDPNEDYLSCVYDMCACTENLKDCLCPMVAQYASTCAAAGVSIPWRLHVPECHVPCVGGQEYQVCPNECTRTCGVIALDPDCIPSSQCAEGCGCPANQTMNDQGTCVAISECPCTFSGQEFNPGVTVVRGDNICTCTNAQWLCAARPLLSPGNQINGTNNICAGSNQEYTTCISDCPVTCQNMHDPTARSCNTTTCTDGCVCKPGYVREGDECILQSECPCYHGGVAYKEGEKFIMDCNECTCRGRRWVCDQKDCPAVCSAYGDSHYTTFDGKSYDFQGVCDYVFARSTDSSPVKFEITVGNVPCGTIGTTCTKTIVFSIGEPGTDSFYRLQLTRGKPAITDPSSPFEVREVGNYIIVTTPQGLTLEWDKGTSLYLRLPTQLKGQVVGLCGNFNGNQRDDFQPKQGGPAETKATAFANSWRVQEYCGEAKLITDTCQNHTERFAWAQRECAIINSKLFEPCHSVVSHQEFYDRCLFDSCACDTGGDCECLCTAVGAYARQCAMNGVIVHWRNEEFCPIMCEQCQIYNPCISICPRKTCDNRQVYDSLLQNCGQETCVEGCDVEPCPPGQVYESLKEPLKCIPEPFCNTTCMVINGKEYKEGERILDPTVCRMDCEVCFCDNGQVKRTGVCTGTTPAYSVPSTTPTVKTAPPTASTLPPMCVQNGPTSWMSVSTPTPYNQGDIESFQKLREMYTFCESSQMTAIECRVAGTTTSAAASGQRVFCDLKNGLKCYHSDQAVGEQCFNYEVRVTCNCGK